MQNEARVEQIKARAKAELTLISSLEEKLPENVPHAKWKLRQGNNQLKEVETFLLPSALRATKETDAQRWLDTAEFVIAEAMRYRKSVQDNFDKYGPHMIEIGG
jgi:hypothetical protein